MLLTGTDDRGRSQIVLASHRYGRGKALASVAVAWVLEAEQLEAIFRSGEEAAFRLEGSGPLPPRFRRVAGEKRGIGFPPPPGLPLVRAGVPRTATPA